tara:strand:- start:102 stop:854 length:753 start_codon:yes stop_codon:yes gene_type:complete
MSKTALITGASSGIGLATAKRLAESGFNLILCGRRKSKLLSLKKTLDKLVDTIVLVFDVSVEEEVKKEIGSLPDCWKNIDLLVNNAGNAHGKNPINKGLFEDWNKMIDINVKGLLYVSRIITPLMVNKKSGHIVNISSIAGKKTYANGSVYCASKKAVEAISEGMRLDLTKHGVKVSNVAPGAVKTDFSNVRFKGDLKLANETYTGYQPLKADDIADVIQYIVTAPERVTIADITVYPKAQAAPGLIYKN